MRKHQKKQLKFLNFQRSETFFTIFLKVEFYITVSVNSD